VLCQPGYREQSCKEHLQKAAGEFQISCCGKGDQREDCLSADSFKEILRNSKDPFKAGGDNFASSNQLKTKAMKATKLFFALSLALILTGMNSINSYAANNIGGSGTANNPMVVTFIVNIAQPSNPAGLTCRYWVVLTDDRGVAVGKAQPFRLGQWSYTFTESGTVLGSRTARMVTDPTLSCLGAYIFLPSSMSGPFGAGRTYTFTLTPQKVNSGGNGAH
jgi:hypothetical protein